MNPKKVVKYSTKIYTVHKEVNGKYALVMIFNIMSVDLEDYFCDLPFSEWTKYQSRIERTTNTILDLFTKYRVKATFFTLGYIAEKFPRLIKNIYDNGHEIGTHSYSHMDLRKTTKDEFYKDFLKSIQILEDITGEKVLGFRAPFFSIDKTNYWVFDILRQHLKYDSSVFPVKTPLYGLPEAPKEIYHPAVENIIEKDNAQEFFEIPPLTYDILSYTIPTAGGFHFRFLPYFITRKAFQQNNKKKKPAMFYIHPKDLDYDMPKIPEYKWHYYYGKKNILEKFSRLLTEFKFTTAKEVLGL